MSNRLLAVAKTARAVRRPATRSRCRAAPAWAAGVGRPAGQEDDLEPLGVRPSGSARPANACAAAPSVPRVSGVRPRSTLLAAMPRRSAISRQRSAIAHVERLAVGDRQREAGAHQQVARRRARRSADGSRAAGRSPSAIAQRRAQRGQAAAADERAEEQPVGPQRAADLRQRAGHVVDAVEHARATRSDRSWRRRTAAGPRRPARRPLPAAKRAAGIDPRDAARPAARRSAVEAAEVEHVGEMRASRSQPLGDPVEHRRAQEVVVGIVRRGAVAAQAARGAVEDFGGVHRARLCRRGAARQEAMGDGPGALTGSPMRWRWRCRRAARAAATVVRGGSSLLRRLLGQRSTSSGRRGARRATCRSRIDRGEDARCAACLADPPRHAGVARGGGLWRRSRGRLALRLKYGGRLGVRGDDGAADGAACCRPMPTCWCRCRCIAGGFGRAASTRRR